MLLIPCPYCGPRPEIEFRCCGEAHIARPLVPAQATDEAFEQYLYRRSNTKGLHRERWRHVHGCARFFNVARNTVSDRIEASYPIGQAPPPRADEDSSP
jgi:sarcosine oxidase subunit delta